MAGLTLSTSPQKGMDLEEVAHLLSPHLFLAEYVRVTMCCKSLQTLQSEKWVWRHVGDVDFANLAETICSKYLCVECGIRTSCVSELLAVVRRGSCDRKRVRVCAWCTKRPGSYRRQVTATVAYKEYRTRAEWLVSRNSFKRFILPVSRYAKEGTLYWHHRTCLVPTTVRPA